MTVLSSEKLTQRRERKERVEPQSCHERASSPVMKMVIFIREHRAHKGETNVYRVKLPFIFVLFVTFVVQFLISLRLSAFA